MVYRSGKRNIQFRNWKGQGHVTNSMYSLSVDYSALLHSQQICKEIGISLSHKSKRVKKIAFSLHIKPNNSLGTISGIINGLLNKSQLSDNQINKKRTILYGLLSGPINGTIKTTSKTNNINL
jgi:hypothetical protein